MSDADGQPSDLIDTAYRDTRPDGGPARCRETVLAILLLAALAGIAQALSTAGCGFSQGPSISSLAPGTGVARPHPIGDVTLFTRVPAEGLDPEHMEAILDRYTLFGEPRAAWADREAGELYFSVPQARFRDIGGFIQDNLDMRDDDVVPWDLDRVWYRINLAANLVRFSLEGTVTPGAQLAMDDGSGWQNIPVDPEDGAYDVQLTVRGPDQRFFFRTQFGDVTRYGYLDRTERQIIPLSPRAYEAMREEATREGILEAEEIAPDAAAAGPSLAEGEESQPPQTRPNDLPATLATDRQALLLPLPRDPPAPERPDRPMPVLRAALTLDVNLVIEGIPKRDPIIDDLRVLLEPFGLQQDYYDDNTKQYHFDCRVLDVEDIRHIHIALAEFASMRDYPLVELSRYLGMAMTTTRLEGELTPTLRGRVPPGSTLTLYVSPDDPAHAITVDPDGRFEVELPAELLGQRRALFGILTRGDETQHVRFDAYTGAREDIDADVYDAGVAELAAAEEGSDAPAE